MSTREIALVDTLELAVPMWADQLRGRPLEELLAEARELSRVIAEKGDVLQFGGPKGQAAAAFNDLARGLAILSFQPGGVKFAGRRWIHDHPDAPQPPEAVSHFPAPAAETPFHHHGRDS